MNKKLTMIMLGIFLLGGVMGVTLGDRESAIAFMENYRITRGGEVDAIASNVVFTSNKVCTLNQNDDNIRCQICFNFTLGNDTHGDCMALQNGTTLRDDQDQIDAYVRDEIDKLYPIEEVNYIDRVMKDDTRRVSRDLD